MPHLGPMELIIILVIVIIVFGVGKLPEIGGALGKGIREFRNANKELDEAMDDVKAAADAVNEGDTKA
jgi:sec-independent protein translocase protein TatA